MSFRNIPETSREALREILRRLDDLERKRALPDGLKLTEIGGVLFVEDAITGELTQISCPCPEVEVLPAPFVAAGIGDQPYYVPIEAAPGPVQITGIESDNGGGAADNVLTVWSAGDVLIAYIQAEDNSLAPTHNMNLTGDAPQWTRHLSLINDALYWTAHSAVDPASLDFSWTDADDSNHLAIIIPFTGAGPVESYTSKLSDNEGFTVSSLMPRPTTTIANSLVVYAVQHSSGTAPTIADTTLIATSLYDEYINVWTELIPIPGVVPQRTAVYPDGGFRIESAIVLPPA